MGHGEKLPLNDLIVPIMIPLFRRWRRTLIYLASCSDMSCISPQRSPLLWLCFYRRETDLKLSIFSGLFSGCLWKSAVGLLKFALQHRTVWIKFPNVVALAHWITRKTSSLSQLFVQLARSHSHRSACLQKPWLTACVCVCVCTVHSCGRLRFSVSALHF